MSKYKETIEELFITSTFFECLCIGITNNKINTHNPLLAIRDDDQQIIPDLLLAFRKQHPKILFSLKEMDNQTQVDGLLSHGIPKTECPSKVVFFKEQLKNKLIWMLAISERG